MSRYTVLILSLSLLACNEPKNGDEIVTCTNVTTEFQSIIGRTLGKKTLHRCDIGAEVCFFDKNMKLKHCVRKSPF